MEYGGKGGLGLLVHQVCGAGFIVLGVGSVGRVLAARLSEDSASEDPSTSTGVES